MPRSWLFALAGGLWTIAGIILCVRAYIWLSLYNVRVELLLTGAGSILALLFYLFLFSRVTRRNINRICALPERPCVFAFTRWQGYLLIGLMITLGITLRTSSLPKAYLILPYLGMGGALLIGSFNFFAQFRRVALLGRPCSEEDNQG